MRSHFHPEGLLGFLPLLLPSAAERCSPSLLLGWERWALQGEGARLEASSAQVQTHEGLRENCCLTEWFGT